MWTLRQIIRLDKHLSPGQQSLVEAHHPLLHLKHWKTFCNKTSRICWQKGCVIVVHWLLSFIICTKHMQNTNNHTAFEFCGHRENLQLGQLRQTPKLEADDIQCDLTTSTLKYDTADCTLRSAKQGPRLRENPLSEKDLAWAILGQNGSSNGQFYITYIFCSQHRRRKDG